MADDVQFAPAPQPSAAPELGTQDSRSGPSTAAEVAFERAQENCCKFAQECCLHPRPAPPPEAPKPPAQPARGDRFAGPPTGVKEEAAAPPGERAEMGYSEFRKSQFQQLRAAIRQEKQKERERDGRRSSQASATRHSGTNLDGKSSNGTARLDNQGGVSLIASRARGLVEGNATVRPRAAEASETPAGGVVVQPSTSEASKVTRRRQESGGVRGPAETLPRGGNARERCHDKEKGQREIRRGETPCHNNGKALGGEALGGSAKESGNADRAGTSSTREDGEKRSFRNAKGGRESSAEQRKTAAAVREQTVVSQDYIQTAAAQQEEVDAIVAKDGMHLIQNQLADRLGMHGLLHRLKLPPPSPLIPLHHRHHLLP
ncbi:hypothetical protein CYMTET_51551 [Cymbomonas tetramitiformis]|uniref:Uncharacterized protein n=1 Tax=Cymbomonas tetramitiformis TaxID=36881 RepID=A0AAE0ES03_9CHLO|nr:hypothetical protein CYMTET_51551 [Cymbomonas tetramitiformis]